MYRIIFTQSINSFQYYSTLISYKTQHVIILFYNLYLSVNCLPIFSFFRNICLKYPIRLHRLHHLSEFSHLPRYRFLFLRYNSSSQKARRIANLRFTFPEMNSEATCIFKLTSGGFFYEIRFYNGHGPSRKGCDRR